MATLGWYARSPPNFLVSTSFVAFTIAPNPMNNNAVITISFNAWKSPAVIEKFVPSPIPNPMKPNSPTAKNPIILLKSVWVSARETPNIIAKIEKKTMRTSKIGSEA